MSPETIDAMIAAGASAEVIGAAWKAEIEQQSKSALAGERRTRNGSGKSVVLRSHAESRGHGVTKVPMIEIF
jgi:hypothetical protein